MKIETFSTIDHPANIEFETFVENISKFDLVSSLMRLQEIGARMCNQDSINLKVGFDYKVTNPVIEQVLLTRDFVSFLSKQIIINCDESERLLTEFDIPSLVFEYGNMKTELNNIDPEDEDTWLWVLRSSYHQWFYKRRPGIIIGRYYYLFSKLIEENENLAEDIKENLGLSILDICRIGLCIYSNFLPRPKEGFATSFKKELYTDSKVSGTEYLLTEENLDQFLELYSSTPEEFRNFNEKFELDNDLLKKYEFNPLKRYPFVETNSDIEKEKYIIPSLFDFVYSFSEGLYYLIIDELEDEQKEIYFDNLGSVFEEYIKKLIHYYNLTTLSNSQLIKEFAYEVRSKWKSADFLLINEGYIIQIECKKRKLDNFTQAGVDYTGDEGVEDFTDSVAGYLDKMKKKENHIKDGKTKIEYKDQEFLNLIVYLDDMFVFDRYGKEEIASKMDKECNNCFILGSHHFEILCQLSRDRSQRFSQSVYDFKKDNLSQVSNIDFLEKKYREFHSSILGN